MQMVVVPMGGRDTPPEDRGREITCPYCRGNEEDCEECGGSGVVYESEEDILERLGDEKFDRMREEEMWGR